MMINHRAKRFRDPVHDTINWKQEGEVGELICALIDSREFQRLRHIRQLGLASLVYTGAEHSRFTHSIGVAHLARRILARVEPTASDATRAVVLCAALLHDLGHGPFSHVLERVFDFHHEAHSCAIIMDEHAEVQRILTDADPSLPDKVVGMITGQGPAKYAQIVSSQLDADRFDYLLRDTMMTGVVVGRFDLERVLAVLHADDDGLLVEQRGWEAVEGYLIARYHMYRLVYFHKTVRAAEVMLERMFRRAKDVLAPDDPSVLQGGVIAALFRGETVTASQWSRFTEYQAWEQIEAWCDHEDRILSLLADGLLKRKLLRMYAPDDHLIETGTKDLDLLRRIDEGLNPEERYLFAVDEAKHSMYQPYVASYAGQGHPIRVVDRRGRIALIEQISPVVKTLGQTATRLYRWYAHPMIFDKVQKLCVHAS